MPRLAQVSVPILLPWVQHHHPPVQPLAVVPVMEGVQQAQGYHLQLVHTMVLAACDTH